MYVKARYRPTRYKEIQVTKDQKTACNKTRNARRESQQTPQVETFSEHVRYKVKIQGRSTLC